MGRGTLTKFPVAHLVSGKRQGVQGQQHVRNVLQDGNQLLAALLEGVREGGLQHIVWNVKGIMNTKMKLDNLRAKNVSQDTQDLRGCSSTMHLKLRGTSASNVQQGGLDEVTRGGFQMQ